MGDLIETQPRPERYLLMKRGVYYRPDWCGYTGIKDHAGLYSEYEARSHADPVSGVTMIREADAPEFSPKCYDDVARSHLLKQRDEAASRIATLEAQLAERTDEVARWAEAHSIAHDQATDNGSRLATAVAALDNARLMSRQAEVQAVCAEALASIKGGS